jgi:hypothetical protein
MMRMSSRTPAKISGIADDIDWTRNTDESAFMVGNPRRCYHIKTAPNV